MAEGSVTPKRPVPIRPFDWFDYFMKTITIEQFHDELRAQGVFRDHLAFVCPMCGTIQSATDLIKAGAGTAFEEVEKYIGFSCVGRWTHRKSPPKEKGTQDGCNWTLGGLFRLHELEVIDQSNGIDDIRRPIFAIASPAQARAHRDSNLSNTESANE